MPPCILPLRWEHGVLTLDCQGNPQPARLKLRPPPPPCYWRFLSLATVFSIAFITLDMLCNRPRLSSVPSFWTVGSFYLFCFYTALGRE